MTLPTIGAVDRTGSEIVVALSCGHVYRWPHGTSVGQVGSGSGCERCAAGLARDVPDWLPPGDHHVVVTERQLGAGMRHGEFDAWGMFTPFPWAHTDHPITGETEIPPDGATLEKARARVRLLAGSYGRARIARLVFLPEDPPA